MAKLGILAYRQARWNLTNGRVAELVDPASLKFRGASAPAFRIMCRGGGIGIRDGLKIRWWQHLAGSSPALGTTSPPTGGSV